MLAIHPQATLERAYERVRRGVRSIKIRDIRSERRAALSQIRREPRLSDLMGEDGGYAMLPAGTVPSVGPAIEYARKALEENRNKEWPDHKSQLVVLTDPKRYEDAPAIFDLVLSDEVIQIASDYLGEVPMLISIKLWWTPVNTHMRGSQLYHRDGLDWYRRQAKFLFLMNDVDENCGPFTFLPADVSRRVGATLGRAADQERVTDEQVFRVAKPTDPIPVMGPAGTGGVVDSSRCFHYGARARGGERLMLMFYFMGSIDVDRPRSIVRTAAFNQRFGNDPIRRLVVPREA
jgi:hypothetical protein